ncbi:MAG: hypothetical protein MI723_16555, partial [Caulobacterales bacterium]|nr:hypothetical protein [Caulobacterales bacterium]
MSAPTRSDVAGDDDQPVSSYDEFRDASGSVDLDWNALRAHLAQAGMDLRLVPAPRQFSGGLANINVLIWIDGAPAVL